MVSVKVLKVVLELLVEGLVGCEVVLTVRGARYGFYHDSTSLKPHQLALFLRRHHSMHKNLQGFLTLDQVSHIESSLRSVYAFLKDFFRCSLFRIPEPVLWKVATHQKLHPRVE